MPEMKNVGCRECNCILLVRDDSEPVLCPTCRAEERARERERQAEDKNE